MEDITKKNISGIEYMLIQNFLVNKYKMKGQMT